MCKINLTKAALWCTAISPLFLTACVDDSYDLSKDIDMTITVGGNLGIPGSGTEEFTLEDIMDLDDPDNSILQANATTGDYSLLKSESGDPTSIDIEGVRVDAPECEETDELLDFEAPANIGDEVEATVDNATTNFTFEKTDIENVTSISSAAVDGTADLTLRFESTDVNQITLKEGFTVEIEMEGQTEANTIEFVLDESKEPNVHNHYEINGQTIRFIQNQNVSANGTLRIPIRFIRIGNFPDGQGMQGQTFSMKVNVIANGTAATTGLAMGNVQATLWTGADVSEFTLTEVTGYFDPNIEDITVDPVTIEDVPDFLNESDNSLDIKNPCIKLALSNNAPIDVNLTGKLVRIKGGTEDLTEPIKIGRENPNDENAIILHKGNGEENAPTVSTYYISREDMGVADDPANHIYYIVEPRIGELIKNIPDEIRMNDITAEALNEEYTIALAEDGGLTTYTVETEYELNAPLQFGSELVINYKDTIDDWHSDLEDISFKKAIVEMEAINGIPLNFNIDATPINVDGEAISDVTVNIVQGNIKPGNKIKGGAGTATESPIMLELISNNGSIENLDGLRITLSANTQGAADAVLNKNMTLQFNNIRIRIEGGVTIDMN